MPLVVSIAKRGRLASVIDMNRQLSRKVLLCGPVCAIGLALAVLWGGCSGTKQQATRTRVQVDSVSKPWSRLDFNNDPNHFQFVVVSDRTGGARPGVFEDGLRKINLLQPEFVMSVGDLIQGGTRDRLAIVSQWRPLQALEGPMVRSFFFASSNHD